MFDTTAAMSQAVALFLNNEIDAAALEVTVSLYTELASFSFSELVVLDAFGGPRALTLSEIHGYMISKTQAASTFGNPVSFVL
jgi:hypothetical protein